MDGAHPRPGERVPRESARTRYSRTGNDVRADRGDLARDDAVILEGKASSEAAGVARADLGDIAVRDAHLGDHRRRVRNNKKNRREGWTYSHGLWASRNATTPATGRGPPCAPKSRGPRPVPRRRRRCADEFLLLGGQAREGLLGHRPGRAVVGPRRFDAAVPLGGEMGDFGLDAADLFAHARGGDSPGGRPRRPAPPRTPCAGPPRRPGPRRRGGARLHVTRVRDRAFARRYSMGEIAPPRRGTGISSSWRSRTTEVSPSRLARAPRKVFDRLAVGVPAPRARHWPFDLVHHQGEIVPARRRGRLSFAAPLPPLLRRRGPRLARFAGVGAPRPPRRAPSRPRPGISPSREWPRPLGRGTLIEGRARR